MKRIFLLCLTAILSFSTCSDDNGDDNLREDKIGIRITNAIKGDKIEYKSAYGIEVGDTIFVNTDLDYVVSKYDGRYFYFDPIVPEKTNGRYTHYRFELEKVTLSHREPYQDVERFTTTIKYRGNNVKVTVYDCDIVYIHNIYTRVVPRSTYKYSEKGYGRYSGIPVQWGEIKCQRDDLYINTYFDEIKIEQDIDYNDSYKIMETSDWSTTFIFDSEDEVIKEICEIIGIEYIETIYIDSE